MKNALAILIGLVLSLSLFAASEVFFSFNEKYHWLQPVKFDRHSGVKFDKAASLKIYDFVKDKEIMKWKPILTAAEGAAVRHEHLDRKSDKGNLPCCVFHNPAPQAAEFDLYTSTRNSKKLVSIAHYSIDEFGRRVTPKVKNPKANILMFGDSYTLGESIDGQYTAPYQLAVMRPDTQVLNFGLAGGSANEILYELQNNPGQRLQGIPDVPTTVLYTAIDHHIERLICRSKCLSPDHDWLKDRPYYTFADGAVTFKGFFNTDRPIRNSIYQLINASATMRFFDVTWPLRFTQSDFDLFGEVVLAQKVKASSLFKNVDFYFVLYPGSSEVYGPQLREACEKRGIKVLDYSNLDMRRATNYNNEIPGDGHPSPVTQYIFATLLDRDLPK